ncbi:MAG: tetratricopeptide repeat protein, partial [Myxococcota bacterium]|nr:tetratricopeptide repeat protein [Myxococcota bacterium]
MLLVPHFFLLAVGCTKPTTPEVAVDPANVAQSEPEQATVETVGKDSDDALAEAAALLTSHDKALVQRAVDLLLSLLENDPDKVDIYYNIAVGYVSLERFDEAQKYFLKATETDPTFDRAWYNLAILTERQQGYEAALKTLRMGLKASEDSPKLQAGIIEILRKQKQYDKAFEQGKEYLKANANNLDIYNTLGLIYIEQEQFDMAKFIFRLAEKKNGGSNNAKLLSSYGYLLYLTKDYQAKEKLESALKIDPSLLQARLYLSS